MASPGANSSSSWHRRSWLALGRLVVGHAFFNVLLNPIGVPVPGTAEWLMVILIGVMFAQPMLFAIWGVLGPAPSIKRVPLTIASLVMVVLAGYLTAWNLLSRTRISNWRDTELLVMSLTVFIVGATVMTLVRKLTRWRIVHASEALDGWAPANQFSLKYLLGLTAICALLLGIARTLASEQWQAASSAWQATIPGLLSGIGLALLATFPAFIVPAIALSRRPTVQLLITVPFLWAALSWLAVESVIAIHTTEVRSEVAMEVALLQVGAASAGLLSAFVVRLAGYRLLSRRSISPQSPAPIP